MYYDFLVKIPAKKGKIFERTIKGVTYINYEYDRVYVSQLQCMLDKAKAYGYKNAGFILDRGYFSRENIKYMDKCGYDFVIMIKGMKALVNDAVKEVKGTFEDSRQYTGVK